MIAGKCKYRSVLFSEENLGDIISTAHKDQLEKMCSLIIAVFNSLNLSKFYTAVDKFSITVIAVAVKTCSCYANRVRDF
jgi:hypothetical protein